MILTIVFIIALAWLVAKGLHNSSFSELVGKAKLVKPEIEMVIPIRQVQEEGKKTIHLNTYIQERRTQKIKNSTQAVVLNSFPQEAKERDVFLN